MIFQNTMKTPEKNCKMEQRPIHVLDVWTPLVLQIKFLIMTFLRLFFPIFEKILAQ